MDLINQHIKELKILCEKHDVDELYVFGSILTDFFEEKSDIDFLVYFGAVDSYDYFDNYMDFKESLEHLFKREIDLLEAQTLKNPILKSSIHKNKSRIYGRADSKMVV